MPPPTIPARPWANRSGPPVGIARVIPRPVSAIRPAGRGGAPIATIRPVGRVPTTRPQTPVGPKVAQAPLKVKAEQDQPTTTHKAGAAHQKLPPTALRVVPVMKDLSRALTLTGDYTDIGEHHGKRSYQRIPHDGRADVFLYFWDDRDGGDQQGWWFGNAVGGEEVWARHAATDDEPPNKGWKVPWDSATQTDLIAVEFVTEAQAQAEAAQQRIGQVEVNKLAEEMKPLWERCSQDIKNGHDLEELQDILLKKQRSTMEFSQRLQKQIGEAKRDQAPGSEINALVGLQPAVRVVQARLATELRKVKTELSKPSKSSVQVKVEQDQPLRLPPKARPQPAKAVGKPQEAASKPPEPDGPPWKKQRSTAPAEKPPQPDIPEPQQEAQVEESGIAAAESAVKDLEDSVDAIAEMAEPLLQDCIGDLSAVEEVENSAKDVEKQMTALRARVAELTKVTPMTPLKERSKNLFGAQKLQTRIVEANKKLMPLRNFKTHFKERSEAKKETEIIERSLSEVELEVEKVAMMLTLSSQIQMCEEEVDVAERLLKEAQSSLQKWNIELTKKFPKAGAAAASEMRRLKKIAQEEHQKKVNQLFQSIKSQKSGLYARKMVKEATEKVVAAEDALIKCSEAEMPFLKGIEVLPKQESNPALQACDIAAKAALQSCDAASLFLRSKLPEVKRLAIEESTPVDMEQLLKRVEACREKIDSFKKETEQRRTNSCLADVMMRMQKAVTAAADLEKWAKVCEKGLEGSVEELTKALEEGPKAQKALGMAVAETSQQLTREVDSASADQKKEIRSRLAAMTKEATKHRATIAQAGKALKSRELLEDQQRRTDQLEAQLAHLQEMSASLSEDEQQVMEEQKVMETLQKSLQAALNAAQLRAANAEPDLKKALQTVLERQRKVNTTLNTVAATSKERREKTLTEIWQRGAAERLDQLQKWKVEAEKLELPFLKGLETLPYQQAIDAVTEMEAVAKQMEAGLQEARSFIAAKSLACKAMGATQQRDRLLQTNSALPALSSWLVELKQTNATRRKASQAQAADSKISAFEKAVDELVQEAAKDENAELKSCEARRAKVSAVESLAREAHEALKSSASKELHAGWQSSVVRLKRAEIKLETSVTRKLKDLERELHVNKLLVEVKKELEGMDQEVKACEKKARLALAPTPAVLCQETIAESLQEHMKDKTWSFPELFQDLVQGKKQVGPEQLVKYVTSLKPKAISEEQRQAWLEGQEVAIDLACLKTLARRCGKCAATARVENKEEELVAELKPGDLLVIHGTKGDKDGKELLEVELPSGIKGFASCKNKEKVQLLPCTAFEFHCEELERIVQESLTKIQTKVAQLTSEAKEAQTGPEEVRAELGKLTPKLQVPVAALSLLQKKIVVSKRNFAKGQASERQKRFENLHHDEVEELLAKINEKVEAAEALRQDLQTQIKNTLEGQGGIQECQRPLSFQKEMKELNQKIVAAAEDARAIAINEPEKLKSAPAAVKQRVVTLTKRSQKAKAEGAFHIKMLQKATEALCASASSKLGIVLRKSPSHGLPSKEELEKIIRKELAAPEEHRQLLLESLGDDELKLLDLSQKYLMVQHPIAMTSSSNLEDAKTVRKLSSTELLQVLDGPLTCGDLQRVFARALRDGMEGWVTMEGNQGTSYVKDAGKPFYVCLSKDEVSVGEETLNVGEVVEVLQGPEKTSSNIQRARCKALSDQAVGWFTLVDKFGTAYAEKLPKMYKCVSPVAMTEELDIESKVMSRLSKGTCLVPEGSPSMDPRGNLQRLRGRVIGSGAAGWVTVKGNAGTVFLEACESHYVVRQPTFLDKSREMELDEVIQVFEVKEESSPNEQRIKVRKLVNGQTGWISVNPKTLKPWTKQYTARVPQSLKNGEVLREVAKGEQLQAVGLPKSDGSTVKVKVKAKKDGMVGWVLIQDKLQMLNF